MSVVIPTFNRRPLLERAVASALAQSLGDVEVIVSDDGSTDDTASVMQAWSQREPRLTYLPAERNRGGGAARNAGIDAATGRYVAFLDSDDVWYPQKLAIQLEHLAGGTAASAQAICFHQVDVFRGGEPVEVRPQSLMAPDERFLDYVFRAGGFVNTSAILAPRPLVGKIRFDPTLRMHQDWDFCLRAQAAGARFVFVPVPLCAADRGARQDRISVSYDTAVSLRWAEAQRGMMSPQAFACRRLALLKHEAALGRPRRYLTFYAQAAQSGQGLRAGLAAALQYTAPGISRLAAAGLRRLVRRLR
ncbi:MAG: glycosyltransferase family 2 protein [Pseudomonadota bacterium]